MDGNTRVKTEAPKISQNLEGRVRNFNLSATADNCLMPIYEAITNSFYAIQERFPDDWPNHGEVSIEVLRDEDGVEKDGHLPVKSFIITDNGIGLTDIHFHHFKELDTEYRASKNGKGIGRLSWLKVFEDVNVISIYNQEGSNKQRSFCFQLSNAVPFSEYSDVEVDENSACGTIVNLENYTEKYSKKVPNDPGVIRDMILAHFVSMFAQEKRLRVNLIDEGLKHNLSEHFFSSIVGETEIELVDIPDVGSANIRHILIPQKLAPIKNSLVFCGADRSVITRPIHNALGMANLISDDEELNKAVGALVYIGLISGDVFDESLNHERTGFDFGDVDFDDVVKLFIDRSIDKLSPYLEKRRAENKKVLNQILSSNPIYRSAIGDVEKYADSLPLNFDETKVVQKVAVKRYRAQKRLNREVEKLLEGREGINLEELEDKILKLSGELELSEKDALAQYVV
ncbi:MAG: hypothetical protein R3261_08895, partial [Alphaproteobacteria bacterium]|nr:hypothetical protein [Alphaproteobacteria bacterium]